MSKITFTKKSLWVNQALKENFVIKIGEDLYKLNMDHGSFENVRYKDEDTRNKN